ncbi:MAG: undecaprenyl-diphosphate phosphatase [Chitinophagales bacterium]|nr:undecaprenyl-diphosphate phosphatase [Chitinophagales bacterium]
MTVIQAIIIAIVEGITEFLPISSTGHMIITNSIMGLNEDQFAKLFIIVIQFGAILSVVALYWKKFLSLGKFRQTFDFYVKLFIAFIPAVVFGLLLKSYIDAALESVTVVAVSLVVGGIILLFIDRLFQKSEESPDKEITYAMALRIGLFQVISMIPGVSRAGATIVGGLAQKLNRKQAAEFSFFLAVPTMLAASAKDLLDNKDLLSDSNIQLLVIGSAVAFVVAMIAIRSFIGYLQNHGFKIFGWYRIIVGGIILLLMAMGYSITLAK